MDLLEKIFDKIDYLKKYSNDKIIKELENYFIIEMAYQSCISSGSKIIKKDVENFVVKNEITYKESNEEIQSMTNYINCYKYTIDKYYKKPKLLIKEKEILQLHFKLFDKVDSENRGKFRDLPVASNNKERRIKEKGGFSLYIKNMLNNLNSLKFNKGYIKNIADFKAEWLALSPFFDGNERISSLITTAVLAKEGLPPMYIQSKKKRKYIKAFLKRQTTENIEEFYDVVYKEYLKSLNKVSSKIGFLL